MENFCENVRDFLPRMIDRGDFNLKKLGRDMGLITPYMSKNEQTKISIKLNDELQRLRTVDDNFFYGKGKNSKRHPHYKSKHAHLAESLGIRVTCTSYKSKNSDGGRRPALMFRVESTSTPSTFVTESIQDYTVSEKIIRHLPDQIVFAEASRRLELAKRNMV